MQTEIVRNNGDLKREVWVFTLYVSFSSPQIYFDSYSFQTKETNRQRKWVKQTHWERLDKWNNNIDSPPLPSDVENEARSRFQEAILVIPITQ